jgi:signal transduction histidine kinase
LKKKPSFKERHTPLQIIVQLSQFIILIAISFSTGTALSFLLFAFIGTPPEFAARTITSLMGLVVMFSFAWIASHLVHNKGIGDLRGINANILDALDRLSKGDFGVFLEGEIYGPYSELAEHINKLAIELGTTESRRQEFISNVSHEIQSPLTSIRGFADLLKAPDLSEEKRIHYIDVIESETRRLSKLSEVLLKLSELETNDTLTSQREYRLDKQIQNVILMLEPQWAEKHQNIEADIQSVFISADEDLLKHVWMNFIQNAIKFTQEEGAIEISLSEKDGCAVFLIKDNGIGIDDKDLLHIFERFYKADKSRDRSSGGSGLGLPLAKKIVELHGGKIDTESNPGVGTSFLVKLPLQ